MLLLEGHKDSVYALAFSPDGQSLLSGAKDGRQLLWSDALQPDEVNGPVEMAGSAVNSLAYDPTAERVAIGSERGVAVLASRGLGQVAFVPGDERIVLATGRPPIGTMRGVTAVRFLTASLMAVGYGLRAKPEPGWLELYEVPVGVMRHPRFAAPHGVRSIDVHRPSNRVAWSEWDRRVFVWEIVKSDPVRFNLAENAVSIAFHPDGDLLAVSQQWNVKLLDLQRRQEKAVLKGHKGQVTAVAFSPDGRTLASGSWDGTVRFWDVGSGRETACYQWPTGKVFALAYAPDGLRMAAGGEKGAVVMWDLD